MSADEEDVPTASDPLDATIINTGISAAAVERAVSRRAKHLEQVDDTLEHVQEILDEL